MYKTIYKYKSKLKVSYRIETLKHLFIKTSFFHFGFEKKRQQQKPTKALIGLLLWLKYEVCETLVIQ